MDFDFFQIAVKEKKGGGLEAYPDFVVGRSKDLMVRAKNFYAVWDPEKDGGLWSTDEYDVQRIVDSKLESYRKENKDVVSIKLMKNFSSNGQSTFRKFMSQIGDNAHQLDEKLTFKSTPVVQKDYVSKRLPYDLIPADISSWDEIVGTLYDEEQRAKIEWAFGAIISGASKKIQKFVVLYGPPGAGKGTIINIAMKLFDGYVTTFDAKALGSNGNQFAASAFNSNPLVAIQHDGDLSRIEDNTTLNMIVAHEIMKINEKFKPSYDARINAFLFMGTNKPVKITDAQSGLIRRLIDVHPTGIKIPEQRYHALMDKIDFELGAIAHHCLQVYKRMGKNYYSGYQPLQMMYQTDPFLNFIDTNYDVFNAQDGVSAKQAWNLYKEYCEDANLDKSRSLPMHRFKAELGNYFSEFHDRITIDGVLVRSYYSGFKAHPFTIPVDDDATKLVLRLEDITSLLNLELAEYPAQYAKANGSPSKYWDDNERSVDGVLKKPRPSQVVDTLLRDLDPTKEHYVKIPDNMIVIDFDLEDENGNKSLERNLEEAAKWPATYGELSRSGNGVHLHYYYDGDTERLDPLYAEGIEVKRYCGNSALRRRLTRCNDVPIATISSGLPLKETKRVLDPDVMVNEQTIRKQIAANLRKEYHPGTKPSIDFIKHILDEAYERGVQFDVSDLKQKITTFASRSTNKSLECLKIVNSMRWKSEEDIDEVIPEPQEKRLVFVDCEVYPNLFVVCWKFEEDNPSADSVIRMINPKPHEVESLLRFKLVGFNTRVYDNHILWAAALGYSNEQLYQLSTKIINNVVGAKFGEAYKVSYVDVYDYSTKKQGLKKWQIELGLEHREMDIPWDQPVPEDRIMDVVEYCVNDVVSLELVHKYLQGDYKARLILADLSGLTPNETTAKHTAGIVFGKERNPQKSFVYTDLRRDFPGYDFTLGKSTYRGELVGEGGYVYAEPGLYRDVALLDVASMHPTSIGQLNLFGEYTPRFMALVEAQLAIKGFYPDNAPSNWHPDFDGTKGLLEGKLRPYIEEIEVLDKKDRESAKKAAKLLRHGLKIAINIVYGLTSAKFDNPFRDIRNVDNIVAKRGALFMIDLKKFVQDQGFTVAHIKTDSIKIPNATPEIIDAVTKFGEKYGYTFEHEATYEKLGLVNDAVYIAKKDQCEITGESFEYDLRNKKLCWTATGTQYQHPYVFKKLFGYEDDINFLDLCETKHVQQGSLHLDFGFDGEGYVSAAVETLKAAERAAKMAEKKGTTEEQNTAQHNLEQAQIGYDLAIKMLIHIGKTGRFTPVKEGCGGGILYRIKDGKHYAVQGTKNHLWVDSNIAMDYPDDMIDHGYFDNLVEEAVKNLEQFLEGSDFKSVEEFIS